jgi:L-aspartate oxidase
VADLERLGVRFDRAEDGSLALGLEGGHSARRVVHAGGTATGRRITRQLSAAVAVHERIRVLEGMTATSLCTSEGRCVGARIRPTADPVGSELVVLARGTVLATGGAAALWARTTNPRGAIGAGLTLASSVGAALADLELVQFHPTALVAEDGNDGFLISEAVRGEGALLRDASGERFVDELAPRDEVARAVHARLGQPAGAVHLDMRGMDVERFPNVVRTLGRAGLDPAHDLVPVAPAAHYTMGGIATDLAGRASTPGLLAVGECACTGLHGANRLASNSLAECFVFGLRAAAAGVDEPPPGEPDPPAVTAPQPVPPSETRAALWRHAGLERTAEGLRTLAADPFPLARLVAVSALAREESRGAHRRLDHPTPNPRLGGSHFVASAADEVSLEAWE